MHLKLISQYSGCITRSGVRLTPKLVVLAITLNYIRWWGSTSGELRILEYTFITITPRSTRLGSYLLAHIGISKKVRELKARHRTRRFDFWGSQRRDEFARYGRGTDGGGRWKRQRRKIVSISLCRRTFKLKGNKRFVPELRSRYVFFEFRDPMFHVYM